MRNKKMVLLGIVLLFLSISIGYAYLTKRLDINGVTGVKKSTWDIYFANAVEVEGSVPSTKTLTINNEKDIVTFGVLLKKPGDYYEFQVDMVNDGTIDAMIENVVKAGIEPSYQKYITFTAMYLDGKTIRKFDRLNANTRKTMKVRIEFNDISNPEDLPKSDIVLDLEFGVEHSQATEEANQNVSNVYFENIETVDGSVTSSDGITINDKKDTISFGPSFVIQEIIMNSL